MPSHPCWKLLIALTLCPVFMCTLAVIQFKMTGILKRPDSEPNQLGSHTLGTVMKNTAVHKLFSLVWTTQITNGFIVISFSMIYFPVVDIWAMQILNRSIKWANSVLSYVLGSAWSFPCHPQHICRTHFSTPVYISSAIVIERIKSWKMWDLKTKYPLEFYVGRWHSKPQSDEMSDWCCCF